MLWQRTGRLPSLSESLPSIGAAKVVQSALLRAKIEVRKVSVVSSFSLKCLFLACEVPARNHQPNDGRSTAWEIGNEWLELRGWPTESERGGNVRGNCCQNFVSPCVPNETMRSP